MDNVFRVIYDVGEDIYKERGDIRAVTCKNIQQYSGIKTVAKNTARNYREETRELRNRFGVKVPAMELLRNDILGTDIEDHPLLVALEKYDGFEIGRKDWITRSKLPLEIGVEEAELLGIIRGDARKENRTGLTLYTRAENREFYETVVGPVIRGVFGLPGEISDRINTKHFPGEETENYNEIAIPLGSKAVVSWLKKDIGFPDVEDMLDKLPRKEERFGYVMGYLGSMGYADMCRSIKRMRVFDDEESLKYVAKELKKFGIKCSLPSHNMETEISKYEQHRLEILGKQVDKLKILNPVHAKVFA